MANDYRKIKSGPSTGSLPKKLMVVLMSFACGYLSSLLMDVGHLSTWVKTNVLAHYSIQTKPVPIATQHAQLPKPKFEFYTLLTNEQKQFTEVPKEAANRASAPPVIAATKLSNNAVQKPLIQQEKSPQASAANKELFLVQVASFKRQEDAERMKASLTLKGFNVNVATVSQQQSNWYRVIIGPFASRTQAEKAQVSVARSEHITGMIRKMDA